MIKNMLFTLVFTALLSSAAYAAEFSSVIEDLPLMPGMTEMKDKAVVFDKPGGRIVETSVASASAPSDVDAFYTSALPPLGWRIAGTGAYTRAGEKLTIVSDGKTVQFKITPAKGQ